MTANLEEEVRQLVSEVIEVPPEEITLDADFFKDLGVDSLKAIEIVAAFEKKYRVIVPENDIPNITTLRQIVEYTKNIKKD